jgi:hypothetical protein
MKGVRACRQSDDARSMLALSRCRRNGTIDGAKKIPSEIPSLREFSELTSLIRGQLIQSKSLLRPVRAHSLQRAVEEIEDGGLEEAVRDGGKMVAAGERDRPRTGNAACQFLRIARQTIARARDDKCRHV